jgi:hypothetical protein
MEHRMRSEACSACVGNPLLTPAATRLCAVLAAGKNMTEEIKKGMKQRAGGVAPVTVPVTVPTPSYSKKQASPCPQP